MEYSFRVRYAYLIQLNIQLIIPPQGLYALFLPYDDASFIIHHLTRYYINISLSAHLHLLLRPVTIRGAIRLF